jgi:hypothetical protein
LEEPFVLASSGEERRAKVARSGEKRTWRSRSSMRAASSTTAAPAETCRIARFRKRGTECVRKPGVKWMSGGAKRQYDRNPRGDLHRALLPRRAQLALDLAARLFTPAQHEGHASSACAHDGYASSACDGSVCAHEACAHAVPPHMTAQHVHSVTARAHHVMEDAHPCQLREVLAPTDLLV